MTPGPYILVWSSGSTPPVPVYYTENKGKFGGKWAATYDRQQATRFASIAAARSAWDATLQWPEDYQHCWQEGTVRVETVSTLELCLTS